jgi:cytochrome c5
MRGVVAAAVPLTALVVYLALPEGAGSAPAHRRAREAGADPILDHAESLLDEGRRVFRDDTFGDEEFWGGQLRLHEAIKGADLGGVGPGLSPSAALELGLKVDAGAVPEAMAQAIRRGAANLADPAVTLELLRANAVIGVRGQFDDGGALRSVGITCALCHSTVDDSVAPGIGRPLDGWPNRDLDVGAIVASAPSLAPFAALLEVDEDTVRTVLRSWGPGRYDAELVLDGKAFRPDGKTAATLLPAAFGLAGVNLHTYTGFGSVPYWNAYVANTQMHGKGTFFDPRLADPDRFPVAARAGLFDVRSEEDLITPKLAALHFYQLAIPAPRPPEGSFDAAAAERGRAIFEGKAKCATCHVPPLYTEPGWGMHTGAEIGIDDFQANRSPDGKYRTTPLRGLFTRAKGGFYHDGRFETLDAVVDHYVGVLGLEDELTTTEREDLVEFLKSL